MQELSSFLHFLPPNNNFPMFQDGLNAINSSKYNIFVNEFTDQERVGLYDLFLWDRYANY